MRARTRIPFEPVQPLALSINEAAERLGVPRSTLVGRLDTGEVGGLRSFHVGRRRLILVADLDRFIQTEDGGQ
jgi:excisionase family DNA binding protein